MSVLSDHDADAEVFWTQARNAVTPRPGTEVTVNDTAPDKDEYGLILVDVV
jgi:hypothetical protein